MTSASGLIRNCGYPRAIQRREEGPEHDRVACAKRRKRGGVIPGCATCGRHSPTCEVDGVCVICSGPRGNLLHAAVEVWAHDSLGSALRSVDHDPMIRGWLELLAMQWSPPPGALLEEAMGLCVDGHYVPVLEPQPHVYEPDPACELAPGHLLTAGRADVVWCDKGTATVLDFKTGRYAVDAPATNMQVAALGFAAADMFCSRDMRLGIYYARDGVFEWSDVIDLESPDAAALWSDVEAAALLDETPRPGEWCGTCWDKRTGRCAFAQKAER